MSIVENEVVEVQHKSGKEVIANYRMSSCYPKMKSLVSNNPSALVSV